MNEAEEDGAETGAAGRAVRAVGAGGTEAADAADAADAEDAAGAKAAFMANPVIGARRLSVSARGGHVHLSGTVEAEDERKLAQSIVERMPGVAGVRNEIVAVSRGR